MRGLCTILGFIANNNIETAQIREFLVATEKEAWQRVSIARQGLDTLRTDTVDFARRNYDSAEAKTVELFGQARQVWTENSEKLIQTVKAAWEKQRSGQ